MLAYSQDLRERIVWFVDEGNTVRDAAEVFKVSCSCIQGLLRRRNQRGDCAAKPHGGGNPGSFRPEDLVLLHQLCDEQPDAYLRELADRLALAGGPRVHPATICKHLLEMGLTRKKKTFMRPSETPKKLLNSVTSSSRRLPPST